VLATVHTGGKALGVLGAYVCGSRLLKEMLINRSRHFIFSTALPPAVGAWWQHALARAMHDHGGREQLHQNAVVFRHELRRIGVDAGGSDYIVPITIGDDARSVQCAGRIQRYGFDVRAIRPPSVPAGTARLRVSIHADHEHDQLHELAGVIGECLN
jgi:8-amino-7-oxononanoate synthase